MTNITSQIFKTFESTIYNSFFPIGETKTTPFEGA